MPKSSSGTKAKYGCIYMLGDFLSLWTGDCSQTTSRECSLQCFNSCSYLGRVSAGLNQEHARDHYNPSQVCISFCHYWISLHRYNLIFLKILSPASSHYNTEKCSACKSREVKPWERSAGGSGCYSQRNNWSVLAGQGKMDILVLL